MVTTRLRRRMQQAMRIRNLSERTVRTYVSLVSRFALFFRRSPDGVSLPEIEQYLLSSLVRPGARRHLGATTAAACQP